MRQSPAGLGRKEHEKIGEGCLFESFPRPEKENTLLCEKIPNSNPSREPLGKRSGLNGTNIMWPQVHVPSQV